MDVRLSGRLAVLLVCGAVLLQQGAGQRHDYRGNHETGHQGCNHGSHGGHQGYHGGHQGYHGGQQREDATDDSKIHFDNDDKGTHQAVDRRYGQGDPVSRNGMANADEIPDITLDNRNFIFAPAFNPPTTCPPGTVRLTKTGPCRVIVRDAAPRGPVRPDNRGMCPSGMAKVNSWCREPFG